MKKQFTILLMIIFILGFVPLNFICAITQNQVEAEVQIVCVDDYDNWYSGSGTIINPKGIILTNRHVVEDLYGNINTYCLVGLTKDIKKEPGFNYLAEVKYYSKDEALDVAILFVDNKNNVIFPYVNVFNYNTDNLKLGDGVEVLGYPSIGGNTLTYVNGVISGYVGNYIKSSAPLDYGNSGGAAYTSSGDFIGIPTAVVTELNSISYILDINDIKEWLADLLGSNYINVLTNQSIPSISSNIIKQNDITPPDISNVRGTVYSDPQKFTYLDFANSHDDSTPYFEWSGFEDSSGIKGYYVYFGKNFESTPVKNGIYSDSSNYYGKTGDSGKYYLKVQAVDNNNNISGTVYWNYFYNSTEKDDLSAGCSHNSCKSFENRPTKFYIYDYSRGSKGDLLDIIYFDSLKIQNITINSTDILIEWEQLKDINFIKSLIVYFDKKPAINYDPYGFREECRYLSCNYWEPECDIDKWYKCLDNKSKEYKISSANNYLVKENLDPNEEYLFQINGYFENDNHEWEDLAYMFDIFILKIVDKNIYNIDNNFGRNLQGLILLQVEQNGEAFYVYPSDNKRYFLGRPADAFQVMRELGLGATHDFISSYIIYPNHVLGKILLDVEQNGEAYYIYPEDKKAYYLGRPADAFRIMRELGLGITNNDLNKIPEGDL